MIKMLRSIFIVFEFLLILNFFAFVTSKGQYSIIAPGTIRSNQKFTVCATLHNVTKSATFHVGIRSDSSWYNTQTISLQPYETKMLDFYPPKLDKEENYELYAESVSGLNFIRSEKLLVIEESGANIYIETDKGVYKPGDLLRFRVVLLNEHAKPMNIIEPIKVSIFDGDNNRVKLFKDIPLKKGIFVNEFQISKYPVLGSWTLEVFIGGKYALEKKVKFNVDKYVLPKFQTFIETDKNFIVDDRYLKINVFGRYTYNKYVEGQVNLNITTNVYKDKISFGNFSADISDFRAKFEIDIEKLLDGIMVEHLIVKASLIEKHTNLIRNATTLIQLKYQRYKISIPFEEVEVLSENTFRINAIVQHWNGSVVQDSQDASVVMKHGSKSYESKLDNNGKATFEYEDAGTNYIFQYKDSTLNVLYFEPYHRLFTISKGSAQCSLKINKKRPKINSEIEIMVESNQNIKYFVYTLVSHGNIIRHDLVPLESNQNSYIIQLMTSNEMVPVSFLYVHYMENNNLIYCETKIELPEELENKMHISTMNNVMPGDDVSMKINAQPGSHIAIVAVDLSSLIYSDTNRINKSLIINEMINGRSYVDKGVSKHGGILSGIITLTDNEAYNRLTEDLKKAYQSKDVEIIDGFYFDDVEEFKVRSYFPETWIFEDYEVTSANSTFNFKVPDSITTWVLSAFSINERTGIGFMESDINIIASKEFFISTYLPYSIKLGEIVSVPIVIFNYHSQSLKTEVIMENVDNEYKFVSTLNNEIKNSKREVRNIIVPANSGKSVNFLILPQKLGDINIDIEARNPLATDAILQTLNVEPDGLAISHNHELFVQLKPGETFNSYFETKIPSHIVGDSVFIQLSISGNVLLPTLEHLEDLVNKPTGCGEQNMIRFAPNILVLEYFRATGQTSKQNDLVVKAKKFIGLGYQQQLKYRHINGGYSVFGPKWSQTPSNWLTAYVVRFFIKAVKYFPIETHIIQESLNYLADQQLTSGEFQTAGYLFHPAYQSRFGFTAFVLLSFLENAKYAKQYKTVIENALNFLSNNLQEVDDIYSLAIMSLAFKMANNPNAAVVLNKLKTLAKTENNLQWWEDNTNNRVTAIEITSYILLALLHEPGQYLPIAKWLLEQRNSHGGFKSTQDTVVGLQALIKFTQLTTNQNDTLIKVLYKAMGMEDVELENNVLGLEPENAKILQQHQLPPLTRSLDIEITGTGNVFLQFTYQYHESLQIKRSVKGDEGQVSWKHFIIKTNAELQPNTLTMDLEICFRYKPLENFINKKANMIVTEIELPSGFIIEDPFNVLKMRNQIKLIYTLLTLKRMRRNVLICQVMKRIVFLIENHPL
ncbi:thioester-containing protein 1 allele S1-like [Cochliomyia hominivorax]